jgi:hypothetical protein
VAVAELSRLFDERSGLAQKLILSSFITSL